MKTKDMDLLLQKAFGGDSEAQDEIRNQFINMNEFLDEAVPVLTRMAVNDHTQKIEGEYEGLAGEAADGVNKVRERVLHVTGSIIKIGAGDISEYEEYKKIGQRSENDRIVPAFVQCLGAIRGLTADAGMLRTAAVEGKLATRADMTKHQGDYQTIVRGVNECLDAVIGPLNVAADYVDKISKGAIPAKITDKYNGDFNVLKDNLNNCIDNINALVVDAGLLEKAAVEGKLATRADAGKHLGDYKKIVVGVNNCLDAVIGPLNVAADYVDKISKGAIPAKISDKYNGDFNVLKDNLNNCIDNINALVVEAGMLRTAAVEGKLDTRADATKHQGDYQKIVKGVNECLDAVIGPLNVAAEYVDRISKGDIPAKITDKYNGDFNEIKNNLNNCIDAVNSLVVDAGMLEKAAVEGKLATRADVAKHHGDYKKIVVGVNNCLDSVIGPLNVAADYVDKISKGAIPAKITDPYNGDFNIIKNNLNNCIDNINALVADAGLLAKAAVEGKLATRADATKHQGDYQKIVVGVNNCLDSVIGPLNVAADYVDKISKGAIPAKITDPYNGDFNILKNNLNNCIGNINALVADANLLEKAAVEGKLDTRADATKHQGDYQKIVIGVNNCLDSVIGPLNVAAEYVDRISKGDIPAKITDKYNGDFNEIKNNLNNCIEAVNALVVDAGLLEKAAVEGKLATRADAAKHNGDYKKIVVGVNNCLDAVIGPLNVAADYVDKISKGAIPAKISDKYNGDFNILKGNLNNCIDNINALVVEAGMLRTAAVEGKLDTRADATKHQGDYQKIVKGVNECLDAVIGPLNVAAEYVDRISKGDIPAKITDKYNGDFNEIKNNLNNCIEAVNALVADANILEKAAVDGKLATRADAAKHQGDYKKIVVGVNNCLDAVIGPLNVAADYVDKISKGAIPAKISDKYNGDFNVIKNNLNNCIDAVNALVADAGMLRTAAVEGKLDTRADASKHTGDYQKIVKGVNECLDAVIGPLNVAAEYVDRISKGDIPKRITDNYNGDFNEIKNNLNNCIDAVNALVVDAGLLEKAAVEGKLATRADASKHNGDYQKIVIGVNNCLNAVIGPLNVAADYVDKISKGAIPKKITDPYNGDFNVIKNNLNNCIDAVNALVADAGLLAKAAVEGKLDTRADASKHTGDYQKIVKGVNDCLDSVIGPLNVAAEYVDRISKGDIPKRITDNYNGDFNEIKNNLNNCIDAVNLLVGDAAMLAKAADEGKLKTRADASKHTGDYKKIVDGVNQTLDSVIEPVNEALRVSKGYATQDFTIRVDPKLKVPGDWLAFKEALNNIGIAVSGAITNINSQVTDLAAGAEEANASVEEVTAGAGQVARNTSAVSTNVEKSMAGIEQVQKAMEDLSRTIQEVATRADVTAKLVQDTTTYSKEGMDLARKTENGMQGITKSSNEVNVIILEIKGQMDKISEIVNLITDLANQTNLLALNAAIEAARAGDAGRGFAVVATEVKSLAVESRASAQKIAEMINNLQSKTNSAVDAVASANSGVKVGSEALHDTLSSFTKIVESIDQVSKNVSDVAAAAEEQAASVEEVTASVNEVGGLMQSTAKESTDAAAASEESAAAIDQISKVIGNVNNIVDKVTKEVSKFKC